MARLAGLGEARVGRKGNARVLGRTTRHVTPYARTSRWHAAHAACCHVGHNAKADLLLGGGRLPCIFTRGDSRAATCHAHMRHVPWKPTRGLRCGVAWGGAWGCFRLTRGLTRAGSMSTEWAKQQEQLKAAGALCTVTEERKKAIQEQHNAALEEIRQARNKTKVRVRGIVPCCASRSAHVRSSGGEAPA
jgi:hypothetical protein